MSSESQLVSMLVERSRLRFQSSSFYSYYHTTAAGCFPYSPMTQPLKQIPTLYAENSAGR